MIKNFNVMMVHANHKPCMCYDMTYQIIIITNLQIHHDLVMAKQKTQTAVIIVSTFPDQETILTIAKDLIVKKKLCACINLIKVRFCICLEE